MDQLSDRPGGLRLAVVCTVLVAGWGLLGASRGGSLLYPKGYEPVVAMWRASGGPNARNAAKLDSSEWATLVIPFSRFRSLDGPGVTESALTVANRELAKGRYGATLPFFRRGIGTLIVINDLRLADLEPTAEGRAREREQAGYIEHVRQVTLAAILAHEATHSLQFLSGEIYPGPGTLPYPGHDRTDELDAYLNINVIYSSELGLTLPRERYESIIRQDYANLPAEAIGMPDRTQAFIEQRLAVDKSEGYELPIEFDEALARLRET